jgi:hypothetical protein
MRVRDLPPFPISRQVVPTVSRVVRAILMLLSLTALGPGADAALAQESDSELKIFVTGYLLAASLDGSMTVHGLTADLNVPFSKILDHLEIGAATQIRLEKGRWAGSVDVSYVGLGAPTERPPANVDLDQWLVEGDGYFMVIPHLEALVGVRFNSIAVRIQRKTQVPVEIIRSGSVQWADPVLGLRYSPELGKRFGLDLRSDVGGFGISSKVTWQAWGLVTYRISEGGSRLFLGYRTLYSDYEKGSGIDRFRYDLHTGGPQLGATLRF